MPVSHFRVFCPPHSKSMFRVVRRIIEIPGAQPRREWAAIDCSLEGRIKPEAEPRFLTSAHGLRTFIQVEDDLIACGCQVVSHIPL